MNNIKFSNENASEEEVRNAASLACALDLQEKLEDGFNTEVRGKRNRIIRRTKAENFNY